MSAIPHGERALEDFFLSRSADDLDDVFLHGTQDLYPHFLKEVHGVRAADDFLRGHSVQRCGGHRRVHVRIFFGTLWAQTRDVAGVGAGDAFDSGMGFWKVAGRAGGGSMLHATGSTGAWGIIPAHLNRTGTGCGAGLMPGFAYQMGILIAAPTNTIEYALRDRFGYAWALAAFEIVSTVLLGTVIALGGEKKGKSFVGVGRSSVVSHQSSAKT